MIFLGANFAFAESQKSENKKANDLPVRIGFTITLEGDEFDINRSYYLAHVEVASQAFLPLLKHQSNGHITGGASERWQIEDGKKRIRFFLRKDLRWSDGSKVVGDDFIAGFKRVLEHDMSYAVNLITLNGIDAFLSGKSDEIKGIFSPNDNEIVFEFEESYEGDFKSFTTPIMVAISPDDFKEIGFGSWSKATKKLTYGPYRFKEIKDEKITLEVNPYFSNKKPHKNSEVIYYGNQGQDIYKGYREGDVEIIQGPNGVELRRLIDEFPDEALHNSFPRSFGIWRNTKTTKHPMVLFKALNLAINREAMAAKLHKKTSAAQFGVVPIGVGNYPGIKGMETQKGSYILRFARAKKIVEKMGITAQNPYEMTAMVAKNVPGYITLMKFLKAEWAKLNVDLKVTYVETYRESFRAFKKNPHDFILFSYISDNSNVYRYLGSHGRTIVELGLTVPKEYTRLLNRSQEIKQYQKFNNYALDVERYILQNYFMMPLVQNNPSFVIKPYVKGVEDALIFSRPKINVMSVFRTQ